MDNNVYFKRLSLKIILVLIIFILTLIVTNKIFYNKYTENYNDKIASIIYKIREKYPEVSLNELGQIINSEENKIDLSIYGIKDESVVFKNDELLNYMLFMDILLSVVFFAVLFLIYIKYFKYNNNKIKEIDKMIEDVSEGNYKIDFENKSEDELSIFRDNLYKITLKLKEESLNSLKDKKELKENLENISHQLKTPLTIISLSVDNILDNNNLSKSKKREFLIDIKREVNNINFLIKGLLELSKFDANVVEFNRKENDLLKIVKDAVKKVDLLRDLKNIVIEINGKKTILVCDYYWEVEAISNIIKNAIEHSKNNSKICIDISKNAARVSVKIINIGQIIDEEELKNIFKRFYKGKNSTMDSVGIGLSLTKSIVEKDNGRILVESNNGKTIFEINYFNY